MATQRDHARHHLDQPAVGLGHRLDHGQCDDQHDGDAARCGQPLDLLALDGAGAAEARHEREPGQDEEEREPGTEDRQPVEHPGCALDTQRVVERLEVVERSWVERRDQRRRGGDAGRALPDAQPAAGQEPPGREQQQDQDDEDQEGVARPRIGPGGELVAGQAVRGAHEAVRGVGVEQAGGRQHDADAAEQPADGVARVARDDQRADRRVADEGEAEENVEQIEPILGRQPLLGREDLERHGDGAEQRRERGGEPGQAPRRQRGASGNHSETCAGCIVSRATARRSAPTASRSSSSRRREPNASSVSAAS